MSANTAAAIPASRPASGQGDEREREEWLMAEAHTGSAWALAALETTYEPMVNGYLTCLTGNPVAARSLTRATLARMEQHFYGVSGAPSLAAWLLLSATDTGLAYLRHVRALQLAGVGDEPRVPLAPSRGGPTAWLRAAFERFRPVPAPDHHVSRRGEPFRPAPMRAGATRPRAERSAVRSDEATRPLPSRAAGDAPPMPDQRDVLRRRVLRAALADLAPPVARCLALHFIAGLSHQEVAYVSGANPQAARGAIVEGLELFAVRYDDALELLGISPSLFVDHAFAQPGLPSAAYPGSPTLRLREGAAPTRQLARAPRANSPARIVATTIPRRLARTLPMPHAPRPIPVTTSARRDTPAGTGVRPASASRPDATPTVSLRAISADGGRPRA